MGFEVNDKIEPAPKNIPMNDEPLFRLGDGLHKGQEWGWDGINQQATLGGAMYNGPSFTDGWTPQKKTLIEIFLHFFPLKFFMNVIVKAMSNVLMGWKVHG